MLLCVISHCCTYPLVWHRTGTSTPEWLASRIVPALPSSTVSQNAPLLAFGAHPELLAALLEVRGSEERAVRVVRVDRDRVLVTDGLQALRTDPNHSMVADPDSGELGLPAVGDWLIVSHDDPPAVSHIAPRYGRLVRRDPGAVAPQILASGVDIVIVTVPLDRTINLARIERELVTAYAADAVPVIAMTKADLIPDPGEYEQELAAVSAHIELVRVALPKGESVQDPGVDRLRDLVQGAGTGVMLGPSGAGKSTLTNAMVGEAIRATGSVRSSDHKGRHVTATRALVTLPGGGALIDTPGLRALGLWDAEAGLDHAFPEVAAAATQCKFSNCAHDGEPGCGVQAAVAAHVIDAERLARYSALWTELIETEEERDLVDRQSRQRADRRSP